MLSPVVERLHFMSATVPGPAEFLYKATEFEFKRQRIPWNYYPGQISDLSMSCGINVRASSLSMGSSTSISF